MISLFPGSDSFHHAGGHETGLSVDKADDPGLHIHLFNVVPVRQKGAVAADKAVIQRALQILHRSGEFYLAVFGM